MAVSLVGSSLLKASQNLKILVCPFSDLAKRQLDREITHTGQQFPDDDMRLARFKNTEKQVNPQFAIDLINAIPPTKVKDRVTFCDGGGGALGHPKVYINVDKPGAHSCGYCGLRFEYDHHQ